MPELPEVETIVRGLRACLPGRRVEEVVVTQPAILRTPLAQFADTLTGARITAVTRHGKHVLLELSRRSRAGARAWWIVHLGMTGQFICARDGQNHPPHTHAWFPLEGGDVLRYTDVRRFGRMEATSEGAGGIPAVLAALGPDPLEIDAADFAARLRARDARVKALLLDQRFLRGMGNIYADETLFRAQVHPAAAGRRLSRARALRLWAAMREVLAEAIERGGSSISDYVDAGGRPGSFQDLHRVYGRTGEPCVTCGARVRRSIVAGRGSAWCPRCQKK